MRPTLSWFGARRSSFGVTLASLALAISCGLSPVDDLPSAVDGFNVDGITDGLDGSPGAGGSSSASGGAPPCGLSPVKKECRGAELWSVWGTPGCPSGQTLIEVCAEGCRQEPTIGCNLGGAAGATGLAGGGGGGYGGNAP